MLDDKPDHITIEQKKKLMTFLSDSQLEMILKTKSVSAHENLLRKFIVI